MLCAPCRLGYEADTYKYLEQLIREMDRKIMRARERADAESRPRELRQEDQARVDALKAQMAGERRSCRHVQLALQNLGPFPKQELPHPAASSS